MVLNDNFFKNIVLVLLCLTGCILGQSTALEPANSTSVAAYDNISDFINDPTISHFLLGLLFKISLPMTPNDLSNIMVCFDKQYSCKRIVYSFFWFAIFRIWCVYKLALHCWS